MDTEGKLRTGKTMLYNPETGRRVREPFNHISRMHRRVNMPDYELCQCFFGEHLLNEKCNKPIAIVESEKTAVIASVYYSNYIRLASDSLSNLTRQKFEALANRYVILFPDANGYGKWRDKKYQLQDIAMIHINHMVEDKATDEEAQKGFDIADYLVRFDYRAFQI